MPYVAADGFKFAQFTTNKNAFHVRAACKDTTIGVSGLNEDDKSVFISSPEHEVLSR